MTGSDLQTWERHCAKAVPDQARDRVMEVVESESPDIVAIDSFKAIHDLAANVESARVFVYDLAVHLALWPVTTFLVGEYTVDEIGRSPEFAIGRHYQHGFRDAGAHQRSQHPSQKAARQQL